MKLKLILATILLLSFSIFKTTAQAIKEKQYYIEIKNVNTKIGLGR